MTECHELAGGLIRIAVSHEMHSWEEYARTLEPRFAAGLARAAQEMGSNVKHFLCSFEPIPMSEWTRIEVFNGRRWTCLYDESHPKVKLMDYFGRRGR